LVLDVVSPPALHLEGLASEALSRFVAFLPSRQRHIDSPQGRWYFSVVAASSQSASGAPAQGPFLTTHWSVVVAAGQSANPASAQALEILCRGYWQPVYGFIRRNIPNVEDARDLTQGFFEHLLENRTLSRANPDRGKFRSFLLGAVKFFLAHEHDRRTALKRGGQIEFLQFDTVSVETRSSTLDPTKSLESQYDRDWALAVLDAALERLREEFELSGRTGLFEGVKPFLTGEKSDETYAHIAARLNITEGAIKMTAKRMRDRFAVLVRQEIAQTVSSPEDLESELRAFAEALTL